MPLIIGRAVGAAVIESIVFCSLGFMVKMDDSVEEWFSDTLCLTKHTASGLHQWTHTELAGSCNVNKWAAASRAWILHVFLLILTGGRDDWMELTAQWNVWTSSQSFLRPLSRCLQEHKKQWGDAWIIYLTQTTSVAPSYSEWSRNNEDGGLAIRDLWTESLSHCRPPELQLGELRFHPRISNNQKQQTILLLLAQINSGTSPPQK